MFNRKKIDIPQPMTPPPAQLPPIQALPPITPIKPQNQINEFDEVMKYFRILEDKIDLGLANQSQIYDLIHDNSLTIREQNNRIRELILNNLVDLPKFEKDSKK